MQKKWVSVDVEQLYVEILNVSSYRNPFIRVYLYIHIHVYKEDIEQIFI